MKNQQQIAMYIGLGALVAVVLLFLMGRIRTERYEAASEQELLDFLKEVESTSSSEVTGTVGPASGTEDTDDEA